MNLGADELGMPSRSECIRLMGSVPIGRIVFTYQALPAIRPVRFAIVGGNVLIPVRPGSRLAAAAQDTIVAFQTDQYDAATMTGWSVTVIGHAALVVGGADVVPTLASSHDNAIRIDPEQVSGHRIPDCDGHATGAAAIDAATGLPAAELLDGEVLDTRHEH